MTPAPLTRLHGAAAAMLFLPLLLLVCRVVHGEILLDLSHDLAEDSIRWPEFDAFKKVDRGRKDPKSWYESYDLSFSEHTSSHVDAPSHMAHGAHTVDQMPLSTLVAPAVVIDIQEKAAKNPNAELSTDDIMAWLREHGPLPHGAVIFVRTGWGARYGDPVQYMGTDTVPVDLKKLNFPGISKGAAQLITAYENASGRRVVGVGIDTMSLDSGNATGAHAHIELFKHNIYGIENVANLDKLPITGAEVTVMPLKTRGGSGGPCRILARIPDDDSGASRGASALQVVVVTLVVALFGRVY